MLIKKTQIPVHQTLVQYNNRYLQEANLTLLYLYYQFRIKGCFTRYHSVTKDDIVPSYNDMHSSHDKLSSPPHSLSGILKNLISW